MNASQRFDDHIRKVPFSDLDLHDPFFASLRDAYPGFDDWFGKKATNGEETWVSRDRDSGNLQAMLYLKIEDDLDESAQPPLQGRRMKIGTFKVDYDHHTSLGKRLLAIALREFAESRCPYVYVTMFDADNTEGLRGLLEQYGFSRFGDKGSEQVWAKNRPSSTGISPYREFPFISPQRDHAHLLAIIPKYHERMFGDIRLQSEAHIPVQDEVPTNTIEKIYLSGAYNAARLRVGDRVVIYRTSDRAGMARYRSVVSEICTVAEVRNLNSFEDKEEFFRFIKGRSVFTPEELEEFWTKKRYPYVISLLFNFPLRKRPTRQDLLDHNVLAGNNRLTCLPLNTQQFTTILDLGDADEGYVVD
ncbi:hypothetical protein BLEM_2065 [Bifidobacterium lemurum]|uniref:N-acetyltransferase domain-containing protein n=1 Tax=Bifidobacterium lemurum TaxID=1603886 RepID=A0A261FL31_9BIFI|nr:hypothetical protein [Bifidobacterium lemurum]OZG59890.1 hypothetical protein BLEM_2065 [Bifidobacterium lemurum]QOL33917.1 hypothetical protein BL8807_09150 [Bifidobacterium lemurum]